MNCLVLHSRGPQRESKVGHLLCPLFTLTGQMMQFIWRNGGSNVTELACTRPHTQPHTHTQRWILGGLLKICNILVNDEKNIAL